MHKQQLDKQPDYTDAGLLQKALQQLLDQISKRDQKIASINAEHTATIRALAEKEQAMLTEIAERDAILFYTQAQLKDREAQLNEIVTSTTWKIALLFQRVRTFLVPLNSRRARILQKGLNVIFFPFKKTRSGK